MTPPPMVAVVDCGSDDRPRLARLVEALPTRLDEGIPDPAEIVRRARDATVLAMLYSYTHVTNEVLAELPDLRLVVTRTAGHSHIDVAAALRRGISVLAVPDASAIAVAEYVLTTALMLRRALVPAILDARAGTGTSPASAAGICSGTGARAPAVRVPSADDIAGHVAEQEHALGLQPHRALAEIDAFDHGLEGRSGIEDLLQLRIPDLDHEDTRSPRCSLATPATIE